MASEPGVWVGWKRKGPGVQGQWRGGRRLARPSGLKQAPSSLILVPCSVRPVHPVSCIGPVVTGDFSQDRAKRSHVTYEWAGQAPSAAPRALTLRGPSWNLSLPVTGHTGRSPAHRGDTCRGSADSPGRASPAWKGSSSPSHLNRPVPPKSFPGEPPKAIEPPKAAEQGQPPAPSAQ